MPEVDIFKSDELYSVLQMAEVVIHLAGVFGTKAEGKENWLSPYKDPLNARLFGVVVRAAAELAEDTRAPMKQFIHASSIHVEDTLSFLRTKEESLTAEPGEFITKPASGYGQSKREQEAVLRHLAPMFEHGAVSMRLGGVTPDNRPLAGHRWQEVLDHERRVWLEHGDLGNLVRAIIEHPHHRHYDTVYATSANSGQFHDTQNVFGWEPQANSKHHI